MSERGESCGEIVCVVFCLLLFIGALKGCDTISNTYQPPVTFTGQVTQIVVGGGSYGYVAEVVLETAEGNPKSGTVHVPLSVSQANSIKAGDLVAFEVIFNNWGTFHHVQSIHKR